MLQQRLLGRTGSAAAVSARDPPPTPPQNRPRTAAAPGACCQGWTRCSWASSENICTGFWDRITAFKAYDLFCLWPCIFLVQDQLLVRQVWEGCL